MAATVVTYALASRAAQHARRKAPGAHTHALVPGLAGGLTSRIQFWRGASGRRHLFSVYSLIECPPLPAGLYLLVRRHADGSRSILAQGRLEEAHPAANLAIVRHRGALAEANEVHVCLAGTGETERGAIAEDMAATRPH